MAWLIDHVGCGRLSPEVTRNCTRAMGFAAKAISHGSEMPPPQSLDHGNLRSESQRSMAPMMAFTARQQKSESVGHSFDRCGCRTIFSLG